jgi:F-type H+-transporting ATPase subunit a
MLEISLAGEVIWKIGNYVITNSLFTTWVVMAILFLVSLAISSSLTKVPSRLQAAVELAIEGLYNTFESIMGDNTRKYFPVIASFFFFIIVSNWFGLLPGVGHSLGFPHAAVTAEEEHTGTTPVDEEEGHGLIPLFRAPTADLNTTFALALFSFFLIQFAGFNSLGVSYSQKFLNFQGGIPFYVGLLEFISEIGKILSFAFRLFGNVFAGEVLILVITFLIPIIVPVPFYGLELFVGFIQAVVFSMLTAVFLSAATVKHAH